MQLGKMTPLAVALAIGIAACGGEKQAAAGAADSTRDLTLPPAESVAAINDQPAKPAAQPPAQQAQAPARQPAARKPAPPPPPKPVTPEVAAGTQMMLAAVDTINSRHNHKGDPVSATSDVPVKSANGRIVIPAGAVFTGTVSELDPAPHPGAEGRMVLTFTRVEFGGHAYSVQARVDSLGTVMKGRGVTTADAAKVGAGAVVGAIAGRIIGGNKTGTIVGAAAGAAAGAGAAAASRDIDIVLPAGAPIRLVLTAPFKATPPN